MAILDYSLSGFDMTHNSRSKNAAHRRSRKLVTARDVAEPEAALLDVGVEAVDAADPAMPSKPVANRNPP